MALVFYFADTTERGDMGWKEAQRQGEDRVTLQMTLLSYDHLIMLEHHLHWHTSTMPLRAHNTLDEVHTAFKLSETWVWISIGRFWGLNYGVLELRLGVQVFFL
jgi:hypothetical protein